MHTFKQAAVVFAGVSLAGVLGLAGTALVYGQSKPDSSPAPTLEISDVDNPARQPIQRAWSIPFSNLTDGEVVVPAGKRLVVEFVSVDVASDVDCRVATTSVSTTAGDERAAFFMPTTRVFESTTRAVDAAGQVVRLYADPETIADFQFLTAGSNCNQSGVLSMSGYLVNLQ